eukprot:tig00000622_g2621.t1
MAFEAYPAHYSLGALAATLTWLLGGTPTASAVIGVGFGYAAKSLYAPAAPRRRRPACAPPGANFSKFILPSPFPSSERRIRAAVAENDQGAGKGRSVGALPLVAIAPGQREAAHAATAALAARRQAEAYPAYFDEANRLSCQELCDNRMRRAVDGHLPLLVALGGSLLMVWYLRGLVI